MSYNSQTFEHDQAKTEANRVKLKGNKNLLYWYRGLYARKFGRIDKFATLHVLEIGSGTSPLRIFYPHVKTSDILAVGGLDFVFDCHSIDRFTEIPDRSVDIITVTNVIHHLHSPLVFFRNAAVKLKRNGRIVIAEPFFSIVSTAIYRWLHHEPVDMHIDVPQLSTCEGPLSSANIALPYLIFFKRREWMNELSDIYEIKVESYFSSISYMLTGGISKRFPLPSGVYNLLFCIDRGLSDLMPELFASFFILTLKLKQPSV